MHLKCKTANSAVACLLLLPTSCACCLADCVQRIWNKKQKKLEQRQPTQTKHGGDQVVSKFSCRFDSRWNLSSRTLLRHIKISWKRTTTMLCVKGRRVVRSCCGAAIRCLWLRCSLKDIIRLSFFVFFLCLVVRRGSTHFWPMPLSTLSLQSEMTESGTQQTLSVRRD